MENTQSHIIKTIPYITDVDFVPYSEEEYRALPEPYKSAALGALAFRQDNWNELVEARKAYWE